MPICPLDIVIGIDLSSSTIGPHDPSWWAYGWQGSPGDPYEAERKLLEELIDNLTPFMDLGLIQVGIVFWSAHNVSISVNPNGFSMSSRTKNTYPGSDLDTSQILQDPVGNMVSPLAFIMRNAFLAISGGTSLTTAINSTMAVLQLKSTSEFASQYPARENDPNFSQVGVVITDSDVQPGSVSGCPYQSSLLPSNPPPIGPDNQYVFGCTVLSTPFPTTPGPGLYDNVRDTLDRLTCNQNSGPNGWNTSSSGSVGEYGFYVDTTAVLGSNQHISAVGAAIIDQTCSGPHIPDTYVSPGETGYSWIPVTYNCSGASGVATPSGSIAPYTCFDPGTGNGQYQGLTAYSDCLANCNDSHISPGETGYSWNCIVDKSGVGQCNSVLGSVGQYITEQDCLANCGERLVDPGLTGDPITYNCNILQLGGTIGVCTDPGDGSGQYTGPTAYNDCLTNCKDVSIDPDLPIIEGWNCDSLTGQCSGPVIGGSYPTLAACQATCGVIGVGGNCVPIDSCPCGWSDVFNFSRNRIDCTNGLTTMPSIKKCMSFQHPTSGAIIQPVIGDTWIDNGSYAGISWTKAVVVNTANPTVVGTGSIEVKTTPCRGL